jgi:hypothetical protein
MILFFVFLQSKTWHVFIHNEPCRTHRTAQNPVNFNGGGGGGYNILWYLVDNYYVSSQVFIATHSNFVWFFFGWLLEPYAIWTVFQCSFFLVYERLFVKSCFFQVSYFCVTNIPHPPEEAPNPNIINTWSTNLYVCLVRRKNSHALLDWCSPIPKQKEVAPLE